MEKLLYASLEQERKKEGNLRFYFILIGILLFQVSVGYRPSLAQEMVNSSPTSDLSLPSFDLEIIKDPTQNSFRVGDVLKLHVLGISAFQLEVPANIKDLSEQGWELKLDSHKNVKGQVESVFFAIPLKPGKLILPSLVIKNEKDFAVGRTNPLSVDIVSAISSSDPKPQEPEGLQGPASLVFPWWIVILASVIVGIILIGIGFLVFKSLKTKQKSIKPELIYSEDEIALKELEKVSKQDHLKRGEYKIYYFKISEILKTYLGARYQFDALESTTGELLGFVKDKSTLSNDLFNELDRLFRQLDQVKFTDYVPNEKESQLLLQDSKLFIQKTKKVSSAHLIQHKNVGEVAHHEN